MKKTIVTFALLLGFLAAFAWVKGQVTGQVKQYQGYYIFVMSNPVDDYEYLGTVKSPPIVKSKDFNSMLDTMIKQAKKDYPDAEALIFEQGMYKCDVIKFKTKP